MPFSAGLKCVDIVRAETEVRAKPEIAQEVEFERKGNLLSILKPERNNLSYLLENNEARELLIRRYHGMSLTQISKIKWLKLPLSLREQLLVAVSKTADYSKSTRVPGFVVNRKLTITAINNCE